MSKAQSPFSPIKSDQPEKASQILRIYGSGVLERLNDVVLFADIRHEKGAIEALAMIMESCEFKTGENIIVEGTSGAEMYILIKGRASVFRSTPQGDEYKVAIFEGEKNIPFGESGLIDSDSRSATIRADCDSACIVLNRVAFERYSTAYPQWALPIYRRIAQAVMARMKKTNNDMLLLYNALVGEIRGN